LADKLRQRPDDGFRQAALLVIREAAINPVDVGYFRV